MKFIQFYPKNSWYYFEFFQRLNKTETKIGEGVMADKGEEVTGEGEPQQENGCYQGRYLYTPVAVNMLVWRLTTLCDNSEAENGRTTTLRTKRGRLTTLSVINDGNNTECYAP